MKSLQANCVLQVARFATVFAVLAMVATTLGSFAHSARASGNPDPNDHLSFCYFGPKVTVISTPGAKSSSDHCIDRVHVQAVMWKCDSAETVATNSANFISKLNSLAQDECRKHCESLGSDCEAIFSNTPDCGLGTDRETAVTLGKRFGCRSDCSGGKAFTYCSLFNAGFEGRGIDAVRADPPNCECRTRP